MDAKMPDCEEKGGRQGDSPVAAAEIDAGCRRGKREEPGAVFYLTGRRNAFEAEQAPKSKEFADSPKEPGPCLWRMLHQVSRIARPRASPGASAGDVMADNTLINDELERVYRLYGERTKQCGRGLYALIVAGLAVFILLVVPYLTFRADVADTKARLDAVGEELSGTSDLVIALQANLGQLREISGNQQDFARKYLALETYRELAGAAAEHTEALQVLRRSFAGHSDVRMAAWARGEAERPPEEVLSTNRQLAVADQDPCFWKEGDPYTACQVCQALVERQRQNDWSLSKLNGIEQSVRATAIEELEIIVGRACDWLTGKEKNHWAFGQPVTFDGRQHLRAWLTRDLRVYDERLNALRDDTREALRETRQSVTELTEKQSTISARLEVLEAQLARISGFDKIGTPVGDLPIGLGQLVLLFPVILAIGFLVVANSHARAAQTQRAFVRLCHKRDEVGEVIDAHHIAAVAPGWLDRHQPAGALLMKWGILATPLVLTLASLWLIADTRALTTLRPEDAAIEPWVYILLYCGTLGLYAGTLWYLWRNGQGLAAEGGKPSESEPENSDS